MARRPRPDLRGKEWQALRAAAFKRDGFRCQECLRPGKLECHHIVSFFKAPELAHVLTNLRSLCVKCHLDLHRIGRKLKDPDREAWRLRVANSLKN